MTAAPLGSRWLRSGSMSRSLGVYLPSKVLHKALALARLLVLVRLLPQDQYGLWVVAAMVVAFGSHLSCLDSHQGVIRYVPFHEAAGTLRAFVRRLTAPLVVTILLSAGTLWVAGGPSIVRWVFASRAGGSAGDAGDLWTLCALAIANAAAMAMFWNALALYYGLRMYLLIAVLELLFAAAFLAGAVPTALAWPTATGVLAAHLGALGLALAAATALRGAAVAQAQRNRAVDPGEAAQPAAPGYGRVLRFGLHTLGGTMAWLTATYLGVYLANRYFDHAAAAVFGAFFLLAQAPLFVAESAWTVVSSHAARRWEAGDRVGALDDLQLAYKLVAGGLMTLTVLAYITSGWWVRILPADYRRGEPLLGGLLAFFQAVAHLGLLWMLARLHERPAWHSFAAVAGAGCAGALAWAWMPAWGLEGLALAGGAGMVFGGAVVTTGYLIGRRTRIDPACGVLLAAPALLLAPRPMAAVTWAGLLLAATITPWAFPPAQRRRIRALLSRLRRHKPAA